jgi:hypothetical protein
MKIALRIPFALLLSLSTSPMWAVDCLPPELVSCLQPNFSSADWPGPLESGKVQQIRHQESIWKPIITGTDATLLDGISAELADLLGDRCCVPEQRPVYFGNRNIEAPDYKRIAGVWLEDLASRKGRAPWDGERTPGVSRERLRVSVRLARAALDSAQLAGLKSSDAEQWRKWGLAGADYILSCQTSSGVFGYPYNPDSSSRLDRMGIDIVKKGQALGLAMVEARWIINDLGEGGLQFDNGIAGVLLLEAWRQTGELKYLIAAEKAGFWAVDQPVVLNWNYNAFSGRLFAQLYMATRNRAWLEQARQRFVFGVLPGQHGCGRWMDPHNARIQYHSILVEALVDYHRALSQSQDPDRREIEARIRKGLCHLSAQIILFGASNPHEQISTRALAAGLKEIGEVAQWRQALHVNVNCLVDDEVLSAFKRARRPLPESLTIALSMLKTTACP